MATAQTASKEKEESEIKGQGRSASYPWIDLKLAEERTQQFWKIDKTYEAPLSAAYSHWGYGPKSSGARLTIAAMLNYGLMTDRGTGEDRMVKLTPLAVELMMAPTEEAKMKARKIAAQKPRVFAELLKSMDPEHLPSDQTIAHYLVTQKNFNPSGAEAFLKPFKGTIAYAKLKKSDIMSTGGTPVAESQGEAKAPPVGSWIQWESGGVIQFAQPRQVARVSDDGKFVFVDGSDTGLPIEEVTVVESGANPAAAKPVIVQRGFKQDTYALGSDEGQVILQWPEKLSQESYDELVDWIDLQMRKIARISGVQQKKK